MLSVTMDSSSTDGSVSVATAEGYLNDLKAKIDNLKTSAFSKTPIVSTIKTNFDNITYDNWSDKIQLKMKTSIEESSKKLDNISTSISSGNFIQLENNISNTLDAIADYKKLEGNLKEINSKISTAKKNNEDGSKNNYLEQLDGKKRTVKGKMKDLIDTINDYLGRFAAIKFELNEDDKLDYTKLDYDASEEEIPEYQTHKTSSAVLNAYSEYLKGNYTVPNTFTTSGGSGTRLRVTVVDGVAITIVEAFDGTPLYLICPDLDNGNSEVRRYIVVPTEYGDVLVECTREDTDYIEAIANQAYAQAHPTPQRNNAIEMKGWVACNGASREWKIGNMGGYDYACFCRLYYIPDTGYVWLPETWICGNYFVLGGGA